MVRVVFDPNNQTAPWMVVRGGVLIARYRRKQDAWNQRNALVR